MALTGFAYSEIDTDFHLGYGSNFVFRGQDLGENLFQYGLDLSGECDCGLDWAAGIRYQSADTTDFTGAGSTNIDRLDIFGSVTKDFGIGSLELGVIHYTFNDNFFGGDFSEVFVGVGTQYAGIDFGAKYFYAFESSGGNFSGENASWGELTAGYTHEYSDSLAVNLGLGIGSTLDADGGDSYMNYNARLSFDFAVSEDITVSPYLAYNSAENFNSTRIGVDDLDGIYGGVVVGFSF